MLIVSHRDNYSFHNKNEKDKNYIKSNYIVTASAEYSIFDYDNELIIYHGDCFGSNGELISPSRYEKKELLEKLQIGNGFFFLLIINKDFIEVYRSLEREQDMFYATKDIFCISSDIKIVMSCLEHTVQNDEFKKSFIIGDPESSFLSPFIGIEKIQNGCVTYFYHDKTTVKPFINFAPEYNDHLETLANIIYHRTKDKKIWLNYSSGLDSSIIFLLLKQLDVSFEAIHHGPEQSERDSEIKEASEFCKTYGVKLHILKPIRVDSDDYKLADSGSSLVNIKYVSDTFSYSDNFGMDNIYLNGQGGDTLYVQNPSFLIGTQLLLQGKPLNALKSLDNLSRLKQISLKEACNNSFKNLRKCFFENRKIAHPLLNLSNNRPADYDHQLHLLSFCETLPQMSPDSLNVFSPLMTRGSICTWIKHPYEHNFNCDYDRILIRKMLFERFNEMHVWKRKKRSSVNLVHSILLMHKHSLEQILENEVWVEFTGMDKGELKTVIQNNITGPFDKNIGMLLSLISLHGYYNSIGKDQKESSHAL